MRYFILSQNPKLQNFVDKSDFKLIEKVNLLSSNLKPIPIMIHNDKDKEYGDLIEWREYITSDKLKRILEKYEEDAFFRPITFLDIKNRKQDVYFISIFEEIDCLSPKSEFHKDGRIKKLVLDKEKIEGYRIFTIKGVLERYLIISLDLAESILRREFLGLKITEIKED